MKQIPLLRPLAILLTGALMSAPCLFAESILSELTSEQKSEVRGGSQIVITEDIAGKPWPRVKVYRVIDATPEQVVAVFFDYENAKSFVPNVIKSEISNRISACTVDVDYGLDVPIFPDEFYTARNSLRLIDENSYCIDWKMLRSVLTKDSVGNFRAEPWEGRSLICYQNLVIPASNIAVLLRGRAIEQMKETTKALAAEVEKEKSADVPGLKRRVAALRSALRDRTDARLTKN